MTGDGKVPEGLPDPDKAAYLPQFCRRHALQVIEQLRIPRSGPWQMTLMAANLACFRALTFDPVFLKRTEGDPAAFSLVLAEIGCLACHQPRAIELSIEILREDREWMPLFEAAFGKKAHPRWPAEWTIATSPEKK